MNSWNILKRFVLVENYPLYAMLGIASSMAIYVPFKHLSTDAELAFCPDRRDAYLQHENATTSAYMGGVYGWVHKNYIPFIKNDELNKHRYKGI